MSVSASPAQLKLIEEIKKYKAEQSGISMMDEFAKHAKLERKIIKCREELKSLGKCHRQKLV